MATAIESLQIRSPNPAFYLKNTSPMALLSFHSLPRPRRYTIASNVSTRTPALGLLPLHNHKFTNRSFSAFAASHEDSKPADVEVENEDNDIETGSKESEEAWKQTLASFKEQALKVQSVSQEAYELYSKKAMVILKETSEDLKIQAEKARKDLIIIANEISEESKGYLSTAAENSPEQVKDILETFASPSDDLNEISKVRDFYVGIPYGALLSLGGFLSFMLTGSITAIRFGVILGGTLLALSVSSLRSWKNGESSFVALVGQAVIANVLFLRDLNILCRRLNFANLVAALISGGVTAFYLYRMITDGRKNKGSNVEPGTQN
jgi:hypothetical protein